MKHRIHLADLIDLAGEISRLREVCKIPDCRDRSLIHKVSHGGETSLGANMDDDLVSIGEQRFSRSMSKSVSGAGDENTSFPVGVQRRWRRSLFFRRFKGLRGGPCGCQKRTCGYPKAYLVPRQEIFDGPWTSRGFRCGRRLRRR